MPRGPGGEHYKYTKEGKQKAKVAWAKAKKKKSTTKTTAKRRSSRKRK
jgi:hypothetical protein